MQSGNFVDRGEIWGVGRRANCLKCIEYVDSFSEQAGSSIFANSSLDMRAFPKHDVHHPSFTPEDYWPASKSDAELKVIVSAASRRRDRQKPALHAARNQPRSLAAIARAVAALSPTLILPTGKGRFVASAARLLSLPSLPNHCDCSGRDVRANAKSLVRVSTSLPVAFLPAQPASWFFSDIFG